MWKKVHPRIVERWQIYFPISFDLSTIPSFPPSPPRLRFSFFYPLSLIMTPFKLRGFQMFTPGHLPYWCQSSFLKYTSAAFTALLQNSNIFPLLRVLSIAFKSSITWFLTSYFPWSAISVLDITTVTTQVYLMLTKKNMDSRALLDLSSWPPVSPIKIKSLLLFKLKIKCFKAITNLF